MEVFARIGLVLALLAGTNACGDSFSWPEAIDPVSGTGVNIHFTDARPGELEMLSRAGFRWVRMDLTWARTETNPGVYDFSAYDRLLADLERFHLRALLILDYTNNFYDKGMPSVSANGQAAFARWAVAAVTHFKNRGIYWEIWNEPNDAWFWKPQPNANDYTRLALTVSQAIHQAAPDERIIGPALSGTRFDFIPVLGRAGVFTYWSGITIHPYLRSGPESYGPAYSELRQLLKNYAPPGRKIDIMCGESGYPDTWKGLNPEPQGKYLARLFLFDVLSDVPLTIWYDWRDDGINPANNEHHFGIVRHDYHPGAADVYEPKPAYDAAKTYAAELTGLRFEKRIALPSPDDFLLSFGGDKTRCLVAWTTSVPHLVKIPAPDGIYAVTGFDGREQPRAISRNGAITLLLDDGPRYLRK